MKNPERGSALKWETLCNLSQFGKTQCKGLW